MRNQKKFNSNEIEVTLWCCLAPLRRNHILVRNASFIASKSHKSTFTRSDQNYYRILHSSLFWPGLVSIELILVT